MIFIDDQAYKEFKELLDENQVESYNIRISVGGHSCQGPVFNVAVSEANDQDEVQTVNEINFIVEKSLLEQYGGFIIVSNEENNGDGVGLKPVVIPSKSGCDDGGGCSGCGGGCH